MSFRITTDACSDLDYNYAIENDVVAIQMEYILNGESNFCSLETTATASPAFYQTVREGAMPSTSMINAQTHKEFFEKYLQNGEDILHIAFSSGLSGTADGAKMAVQELKEEYPDRKIMVVDSLCASMGEGLLVYKAVEKRKTANIEETFDYIENLKHNLVHIFTVDSLDHLHRGGRVSKMTAVIGGALKIKPVLHVDENGKLVALAKAKGRKKSLDMLVSLMQEKIVGFEDQNDMIFISHGDAKEDAQYVADKISEKLAISTNMINFIGPVIGAHSGSGTIALFFVGSPR